MWEVEAVLLTRELIGDAIKPFLYSDERIQALWLSAAQMVLPLAKFSQSFYIDLDEATISPDPTERASRDDDFLTLVSLRAACIVGRSEQKRAAGQAISIRDGASAISLQGAYVGKSGYAKEICGDFTRALTAYKAGGAGSCGKLIATPYHSYYRGDYYSNERDR